MNIRESLAKMDRRRRKLTPEIVACVKRDLARGVSQSEIARRAGVNPSTIQKIASGVTWR